MDFHIRQVSFKSVANGYVLQYGQQTNGIATQEEAVFNTLGQVSAHIDKLDEEHKKKVKDFEANAAKLAEQPQSVEGKQ